MALPSIEPVQQATRIQHFREHLRKGWSMGYLNKLQQWQKWMPAQDNSIPEALVTVKDDNILYLQWKSSVIMDIHPGIDGFH
jgi:hypothetical protein